MPVCNDVKKKIGILTQSIEKEKQISNLLASLKRKNTSKFTDCLVLRYSGNAVNHNKSVMFLHFILKTVYEMGKWFHD